MSPTKFCPDCKVTKERKDFYNAKHSPDKLFTYCKPCGKTRQLAWEKLNPRRKRGYEYKTKFGITLTDYNKMFEAQQGVCAICLKAQPNGYHKHLAVDHNHDTGKVRELLCTKCNTALGHMNEDFTAILRMAEYVRKHTNAEGNVK